MTCAVQTLTAAYLWPDLGWLTLRLCHTPGPQPEWRIFASATSGPSPGDWLVITGPNRAPLAQWMALLDADAARALLLNRPCDSHPTNIPMIVMS